VPGNLLASSVGTTAGREQPGNPSSLPETCPEAKYVGALGYGVEYGRVGQGSRLQLLPRSWGQRPTADSVSRSSPFRDSAASPISCIALGRSPTSCGEASGRAPRQREHAPLPLDRANICRIIDAGVRHTRQSPDAPSRLAILRGDHLLHDCGEFLSLPCEYFELPLCIFVGECEEFHR
jgi:hypothetical protein